MDPRPDLTKSQLFLDDSWIEDQQRLTRLWHKADIFPEPVLRPENPWEGNSVSVNGTVFKVGDRWRMYYKAPGSMCVAESEDGLQWERPTVGQFEYQGSTENNIVMRPVTIPSVCYEPEDVDAPFKMITLLGRAAGKASGIYGAVSKDGFRWTLLPGPILTPTGDVMYIMFKRANGKYVIFLKTPRAKELYGTRCVSISQSDDFRSFPEHELIQRPDLIDPPDIEYHGMVGFPYADLYLGLAERWHNVPNFIEVMLSWSYDLKEWHRPVIREPFIGPAYAWNEGWSTCSSGPPIQVGNQLWFYFAGKRGSHFHAKQGPPNYSVVGLATITVDRFASITAGFMEGKLVTRPMTWPGGDLLLNASTTRNLDGYPLDGGGAMSIEVWDEDGHPLEGFSGEQRAAFDRNTPTRGTVDPATIHWPDDRSLNELTGRRIKLVFYARDSHLYSFRSSG